MTSVFYFLLSNPECYTRVQTEVDTVYPKDEDALDAARHGGLSYLNACISEALRLHPPAATGGPRQVPRHSGGKVIADRFVPEGTQVYLPPYSLHRDARDDTSVGVGGASTSTLVPEKKGKMRRICNEDDDSEFTPEGMTALPPHLTQNTGAETKKQRRKWTAQETQMLVDGCQKWGVGNWKAILNDPELKFDNRSPVDLKDRKGGVLWRIVTSGTYIGQRPLMPCTFPTRVVHYLCSLG
ncbi:hypothetical protein EW026_g5963 [Hermanssonia centrifuga]|uniref:Myb-like domain-containing protein n=1 Tax=Hermanssonia centrifuga TaxID=98765 RepID=A0A4S4KE63_9APHY|nr:hypothetical protein EW026_g5963 [Hermanssonia centrifuga]